MRARLRCALLLCVCCACSVLVHTSEAPQLKTASTHPIQYYLSLPDGWTAGKKWPVVVVIDSAEREFSAATTAFAQARQKQPFIIVTPLVVTNGGAGARSVPTYHYSDQVWDRIQRDGPFKFDMDGIAAIIQDVTKQYGGEDKYFITGLEAAGHTVYGVLFNHPEAVRGAAIVCPNYLGRWVDEAHMSTAPERSALPIEILSVRRIVSARPVLRFTPKCKRRSAWPRRTDTRTFRLPQSKARDTNVLRTKCSHISHPSWRNELSVAPEGDALQLLRYRRGELLLDH